jgi:hypothetical protein
MEPAGNDNDDRWRNGSTLEIGLDFSEERQQKVRGKIHI